MKAPCTGGFLRLPLPCLPTSGWGCAVCVKGVAGGGGVAEGAWLTVGEAGLQVLGQSGEDRGGAGDAVIAQHAQAVENQTHVTVPTNTNQH